MSDRQFPKTASRGDTAAQRGMLLLPPLNAVLELALFVVVVLAVDAFVPSFSLNSIEPNPSWLPVLLLSVQYGTVSGLLAAGVCIALSMQTGFPEQDVGENLFVYLLRAWAQPMLWISAAVLLGQFRTRHIAERAELTQDLATLSSQRTAIAEYANNLRARCDALERHLASRDAPEPVAVLAALAQAAGAGAGSLVASFRSVLAVTLPGASASLFLLTATGARLLAATDDETVDTAAGAAPLPPALLADLEARRRPVSIMSQEGERLLAGRAQVAVPVEAGDRLAAVILIHRLDAQALSSKLTMALPVLAAALAPAIEATSVDGSPEHADDGAALDVVAVTPGAAQPWLKRLWKGWPSPAAKSSATLGRATAAEPARADPPTRRLVR